MNIDIETPPAPRLLQCWEEEPDANGLTKVYMLVMLRDSERALLVDAIATEVMKRLGVVAGSLSDAQIGRTGAAVGRTGASPP